MLSSFPRHPPLHAVSAPIDRTTTPFPNGNALLKHPCPVDIEDSYSL